MSTIKDFSTTIDNSVFNFKHVREGNDEVFLVNVEGQNFRMITDDDGTWGIWQQVPAWIKNVEEQLSNTIEAQYS